LEKNSVEALNFGRRVNLFSEGIAIIKTSHTKNEEIQVVEKLLIY
jgi:hypothetical protein